jgi:hypothetical protein
MSYTVTEVSNSRQLKDFLRLPFLIYRHDPNWVAPITSEVRRTLDAKLNPYFANASLKLFVCYKAKTAFSRLAIIINRLHQEKFGVRRAFFGFFESMNDFEAAKFLFDEAERYCRRQGVKVLEGPFNPSHYSELGLQLDQFEAPPTFFQTYNPPYYNILLERVGFQISVRFQTMKNENLRDYILQRYGIQQGPLNRNGYIVRSFSMGDFKRELERIREVNNDAFSSNWHFLPLSKEEYLFSAKYLNLVTRPELIKIVEHEGQPVGVLHCVLDINPLLKRLEGRVGPIRYLRFLWARRKIRKLIIYTVAIKKAYQHTRVYELLLRAFCQMALKFETSETTWLSAESAPAVKAAESIGMKPDKQFAIYEKYLSE